MNRTISILALAAGMSLAPACVMDQGTGKPDTDDTKTDNSDTKAERWGAADSPSGFASNLNYKIAELPQEGEATNKPWPETYWPTYRDSVNYKWAGPSSDSAVKKYEKAFGGTGLEDKISQYYGIDHYKSRTACTKDSDCNADIGEACAKRDGKTDGYCIPSWWGICHAWSPLAVLHAEPEHAVTYNGVTFEINDIKALMTIAFDKTRTKFVSLRCNTNSNDLANDAYGRPADSNAECRDTNPGTMHVLVTNYLGLRGEGFVEDRTFDDQVWNQPLEGYTITQQDEISARDANELLGAKSEGGRSTDANGSVAKDEWKHQAAVAVNPGEGFTVIMSGSDDADLYVKFGSQPTTSSYDCRPYAGGSSEECALTVPDGVTQAFVSVRGYAASSNFQLHITAGGHIPDSYVFNADADKFYHVKMNLRYITEASAETNAHLGGDSRYIRTDHYEYILELQNDKIIGGEWVGASKHDHPDFLWLPLDRQNFSIAGGALSYSKIKLIYDQSISPENPGGGSTDVTTVSEDGTVAKNEWKHYGPFEVGTGGQLKATMTGSGDADLYVRKGSAPTPTEYDCRPYKGSSNEECTVTGAGTYYVSVRGYAATSDFSVDIEYGGTGTEPPPVTPPTTISHLNLQDSVEHGQMKYYTVDLPAGATITIKTFAPTDIDLYIQMGSQPTTDSYLERAWTTSGNETLTYTATSNGTLHIGVAGYASGTSDFTLRTE